MKPALAVLVPSLFAAGCGSITPLDEDGALARVWGERLQQYRIIPAFPPREDIQVGDIYLACLPKERGGLNVFDAIKDEDVPSPLWVASLQSMLGNANPLYKHYESRLSAPVTPEVPEKSQGGNNRQQVMQVPTNDSVFVSGATNRLRNVSFPEFFSVGVKGANVGALVPTPSALIGLGVSTEEVESISVSVPVAESYGLPAVIFDEALSKLDSSTTKRLQGLEAIALNRGPEDSGYCRGNVVYIGVTEVFAARAIDVRMNFKAAAAARLEAGLAIDPESRRAAVFNAFSKYFASPGKRAPTTPGEDGAQDEGNQSQNGNQQGGKDGAPAIPTKTVASAAGAAAPSLPHGGAGAQSDQTPPPMPDKASIERDTAYINALNQFVQLTSEQTRRDYPGVSITTYRGGLSGINMVREFANPVVIGYRGVLLARASKADATGKVSYTISGTVPNRKRDLPGNVLEDRPELSDETRDRIRNFGQGPASPPAKPGPGSEGGDQQ